MLLLYPAIGEQWAKIVAGWSGTEPRKPREDVPQIGEGVQAVAVATGDQTEMDGSGLGAPFAATEEPILPADRQTTQCSFGSAIVDRQCAVGCVSHERLPVIEQVRPCCPPR